MKKLLHVAILPYLLIVGFFVISLFTLYDYGMNWDSPVHFSRGQAFLRYIVTGKENYNDLPKFCLNEYSLVSPIDFKTGEVCDRHRQTRVSEFESSLLDFKWAQANTYGHPAFTSIMIAVSNQIFFKWLGLIEDIEAYHLFGIFVTFLLAFFVVRWMHRTYGVFPAIISGLALYTFPLLFSEQHFNVKDPSIAAFFTGGIYYFYRGIVERRANLILLSAILGGFSFATKINYVFAPFILAPWFITFIISEFIRRKRQKKARIFGSYLNVIKEIIPPRVLISFVFYPIIIISIFFFTWPALWVNPIESIKTVFIFYNDVGVEECVSAIWPMSEFFKCWDFTTLKYIFFTLPPITILLSVLGILYSVLNIRKHKFVSVLWITFLVVTIGRVTLPIASVYGGLRQIMEFIAPTALLSGLGALFLVSLIRRTFPNNRYQWIFYIFITLLYLPIIISLIRLHPNQNLYFNFFIGGLRGAAEKDFPGYGNTYGNSYKQIINWLNENAEKDAKIVLVTGTAQNITRSRLREDMFLENQYRSSYNLSGEYLISLVTQDVPFQNTFRHKYVDNFLVPVAEGKVDGVPIYRIWKNDRRYIKEGFNPDRENKAQFEKIVNDTDIVLMFENEVSLKRLELYFTDKSCVDKVKVKNVQISADTISFRDLPDPYEDNTLYEKVNDASDLEYFFAKEKARAIKLPFTDIEECIQEVTVKVYTF